MEFFIVVIGIPSLIMLFIILFLASRYKRCPSNRVLVIYGRVSGNESSKCIHGGGAFVFPLIQASEFLNLEPMTTEIELTGALSLNNIRVNIPSTFTFGISTNPNLMINAAERLLGLNQVDIIKQANDIILGQLRLVIATLAIEEINQDREKFLEQINKNVNTELNKVGLEVINVNIRDITDESGYIDAIGKRAAAEAINKAKVEVAQQEKYGAIGEAEASKEKEIQVAQQVAQSEIGKTEALKNKRIQISNFESEAVKGENTSKAEIATYEADLSEKRSEAMKRGEVAQALAEREILLAQRDKEQAKLEKEEIVKEEIEKRKIEIQSEAEAEKRRRIAAGEADSVKLKYLAEAEGIKAVLESKAEGYEKLISVCKERPDLATSFLMIEKIDQIVEKQVEAIKNIKFDKITVWDSGSNGNGSTTTANFLRGMINSLPAMHDLAKQAGVKLPEYLGQVGEDKENNKDQKKEPKKEPNKEQN